MNVKKDFPIFDEYPNLVYLDSGATTHKPHKVINTITEFYQKNYGTVHRGIYDLSVKSTEEYNQARKCVQTFINSKSDKNIIFTRGTTDSINLAAFGYLENTLKDNDEIIITEIEHHANFVPWQQLAKKHNISLKFAPIEDDGTLNLNKFKELINKKTTFIAVTHISNVLGTILPIKEIIELAKENNAKVLIDGAQAIAHQKVNIQDLDPDFYCFSGHKMYGPTGIGICYASDSILEQMQPITFGGDMIETVKKEGTTFTQAPLKFEAGTPPIVEAIGLKSAINYIDEKNIDSIKIHEDNLTKIALKEMEKIDWISIIGSAQKRSSTISFNIDGIHPHDLGTILDTENIAIRVGHHCAQPTMKRFNVPATARVSFGIYNNENEIDLFIKSLHTAREVFGF
ncbi:MAG: SufS family cysteine desulfurase [Candidatus Margulisiibacteriota bacterium]